MGCILVDLRLLSSTPISAIERMGATPTAEIDYLGGVPIAALVYKGGDSICAIRSSWRYQRVGQSYMLSGQ